MPNATEFRHALTNYSKARIPFVTIRSQERQRVKEILTSVSRELSLPMYYHSLSEGLRELQSGRVVSEEKSVVGTLEFVSSQFRSAQNQTFVFSDVRDLDADSPVAREFNDLVMLGEAQAGSIFVLTNDPVWPTLSRLGMSAHLDPPDLDEMGKIIRDVIEPYRGAIPVEWSDADFQTAASILAGVTQLEAENVLATLIADGRITAPELDRLSGEKDRIFSDLSGIERVQVNEKDHSVGGLGNLHHWLERKRQFMTADLRSRKMRPPRGILLVGVPGCGKSLSAKAIAGRWKLPLYRLDMAAIMGQYVGQSEGRLREALATADHVAPCVLWIDEIEKALGGSGTDSSGVSTRLLGQFLYWLQESSARVFVVATANDVSQMPAELLRAGRFDELFFVDLPSLTERDQIVRIYATRYLETTQLREDEIAVLAEGSEGFSGADIEKVMRDIGEDEILTGAPVQLPRMMEFFGNLVPLSQTNPEAIDAIRNWGTQRAVPASPDANSRTMTDDNGGRRVLLS